MPYTSTSKFVQLTPYILMEYFYATSGNPESYYVSSSPVVGFEKIVNGYLNNSVQILNDLNSDTITQNTRYRSVVAKNNNRFVDLNPNKIIQYLDTDNKLTSTSNLPVIFPQDISVTYDTIRFHLISGYGFDGIDGLILLVLFPEKSKKYSTVSQIILEKGNIDFPTINPNPIYLSGGVYDKYIQIKIPSYFEMNKVFDSLINSQLQSETLAAKISSDGNGFLRNSPIIIQTHEIIETIKINDYDNYTTSVVSNYSLNPYDEYGDLAANLNENTEYNYIEYWPSWQGNYIEEFINTESTLGNNYYAIHDIELKEQVGLNYFTTYNSTTIQQDTFNGPLYFRPVLKNGSATSFLVNYTVRLFNKKDSVQVIRKASYTSYNVNKYGKNLMRINLATSPGAQKVYNKIVEAPKLSGTYAIPQTNPPPQSVGVPIFCDFRQVSITKDDLIIDQNGVVKLSSAISDSTVALGQGNCQIIVSPFDNYYRFKIFNTSLNKESIPLNLGGTNTYYLVFIGDKDQTVRATNLQGVTINNPAKGELVFVTSEQDSRKIMGFTNREFHIVSKSTAGTETSIYIGTWIKSSEIKTSIGPASTTGTSSTTSTTVSATGSTGGNSTQAGASVGNTLKTNKRTTSLDAIRVNEGIPITTDLANKSGVFGAPISDYFGGTGSVKSEIVPVSGKTTKGQYSTKSVIPNSQVDIPSLAQFIKGNEALGMTPQGIADYFLKPGNPGYNTYKGITKYDFLRAVDQIYPKVNGVNDPRYNTYSNYLGVPLTFDVRTNR